MPAYGSFILLIIYDFIFVFIGIIIILSRKLLILSLVSIFLYLLQIFLTLFRPFFDSSFLYLSFVHLLFVKLCRDIPNDPTGGTITGNDLRPPCQISGSVIVTSWLANKHDISSAMIGSRTAFWFLGFVRRLSFSIVPVAGFTAKGVIYDNCSMWS